MLPHLQYDGRLLVSNVAPINAMLAHHLGLRTTVLRCVHTQAVAQHLEVLYLLENHSPQWMPPPGWQWIGRERFADLPLTRPEHQEVLATCLTELESGVIPDLRPPWARPGWFATAQTWMQAQVERMDLVLIPPIVQVRNWGISCVLRTRTMTGDLYLKVSSRKPLFTHEPALMQSLAMLYPAHIPLPLAVEQDQGWMLLADFGEELRSNPDHGLWEDALCTFAALQQAAVPHVDLLLASGCRDRRLQVLATQIEPLLHDTAVRSGLQEEEHAQLHRLVPRLRAMCDALAAYRVPQTLVHGDLHPGNIAASQGTFQFFDWTDGCIAHPFFDLVVMLADAARLPEASAVCSRLRERYLALWTAYEPLPRVQEAWQLAEPLGALHQAVSYQHIVAGLEPTAQHELAWGVPFWLRKVLQVLSRDQV